MTTYPRTGRTKGSVQETNDSKCFLSISATKKCLETVKQRYYNRLVWWGVILLWHREWEVIYYNKKVLYCAAIKTTGIHIRSTNKIKIEANNIPDE